MLRLVALSAVLVACAPPPAATSSPTRGSAATIASLATAPPSIAAEGEHSRVSLTFIGDHNFAPGTELDGVPFGGISALAFDSSSSAKCRTGFGRKAHPRCAPVRRGAQDLALGVPHQRWLALSDAHEENGPARMYELAVALDDHSLAATVTGSIALRGPFESGRLDPEGLARNPQGGWLISTEGDGTLAPRLAPALYRVDDDGTVRGEASLSPRLTPTASGPLTHGVTHNRGLEGLSTAPSGNAIYTINESPLAQDGDPASFEEGGRLRLMRFDRALRAVSEHFYLTEPVPRIVPGTPERVLNGVAALTALDDDRLLALERATVKVAGVYHVRVQVFEVHLAGSEDVSRVDSLVGHRRPVSKRLVLDLDDVVEHLEEGHRALDNFEGMALGPILPSGAQSLLMVTDDNFSRTQRTVLLAFALKAVAP